jgi:hypothetical protein
VTQQNLKKMFFSVLAGPFKQTGAGEEEQDAFCHYHLSSGLQKSSQKLPKVPKSSQKIKKE